MKNALDFVRDITTQLSGKPTEVTTQPDDQGYILDVEAKSNLSSIIGKEGRTINAIRVIANALGYEDSHRLRVRLNERED